MSSDQPPGSPESPWPATSRLRRLIGTETATKPIPLVDRLRGTPYRDPTRPEAADQDRTVREALELVVQVAALLVRCGTGTAEVETSALAAAVGLGLDEQALDLDITWSSIVVGYAPGDRPPLALVRVVASPGRDYARMSELHRFVVDVVGGRLDLPAAQRRLAEIERSPKPYKRAVVTAAWGALSAAIVLRLGGGWAAVLTAFVATAVVDQVGRRLGNLGVPAFFATVVGAALATVFALGLSVAGDHLAWLDADGTRQAALVVSGGIVVLLPGIGLVGAVQDGIRGYPVTGVGRLFSVLLSTGGIIAGVAVVLSVSPQLGAGSVALDDPLGEVVDFPVWWTLLVAGVGCACAGLASRTPPRLLLPVAASGALGFAVSTGVVGLDLPVAVGAALGCTVIGVLGRVWALRRVASPLAVVVPATTMLLPGLTIFEGLRLMTDGSTIDGLVTLLTAGTTGVAIAAGVTLGDSIAAPVERGLDRVASSVRRRG